MRYSLGVDLGTTFVAAATASTDRVKMFTLGDRSVVSPAVVYLRDDGALVTGEAASLRAMTSPDRVSREFKRRLGNPTPVVLGGQPYDVTALLGALLHDVLQKVIETEGDPPERLMLTHPANWGPFRRALFEEVPQYAGLNNPPVVTEPEAAATHYATSKQLADGQTVAVYDLGGGTFDATILRARPGGVDILGTPEGIERLGGVDFDETILSYVDYAADGALSELDLRDPQAGAALARLRQDCVLAKEALSADTETVIPVFLPGRQFDVRLTRSDFEDMVRAPIESTIGALSRTLEAAEVKPAELSAVLLVGGSSRIPLIARMVSAELGRPTVVDTHPKNAVALGAATLAARAPAPAGGSIFSTRYQQTVAPTPTPEITPVPKAMAPPATPAVVIAPPLTSAVPPTVQEAGSAPAAPAHRAPAPVRRQRRPWLLISAAAALVVATAAVGFVLLKPLIGGAGTGAIRLTLSTCQIKIGESYTATAGGFAPGENVRFSWTGPTTGVMGAFPADSGGNRSPGKIFERDPPGTYAIIATGLKSGRTTSAGLVVADAGAARLRLSTCQAKAGDSYTATAAGFAAGENIRFSWIGPTNGVAGTLPANATGMASHGENLAKNVPGTYTITATGLTSGRTASAGLQVLQARG
ncbi:MAG: Hsp70 family protein [Pseudonocardiaceae bacterium]